jgi:hypothetical protein
MKKWIARILAVAMVLSLLTVGAQAAGSYQETSFEATGMMFGGKNGKVTLSQARTVMTDYGTVDYYAVPESVTITVTPYEDMWGKASLVGLRYYDVMPSTGGGEVYDNMNHYLLTSAGTLKEIGDYNAYGAADLRSDEYALTANKAYTFTIDTTKADRIDLLCSQPNDLGVEQVAVLRFDGEKEEPTAPSFTDVKPGAYYADAVTWAVEKGITTGKTGTTFAPGETCSTAHILTFLWRANGSPEPSIANPFTDVKEGSYYYKAALWAYEKGLVSGNVFTPSGPCTRGQTMLFLYLLAGSPAADPTSFTDVAPDSVYNRAISWAVSQGITTGKTGTTFAPDEICTRGHIVTFLYRAMGK